MKAATLHWYRTRSDASPLGFELRADHRGRTWRMYRMADSTWRVRPTDRPQKEATFRSPEEARKWASEQAALNPRDERRARNPQRARGRSATFRKGQKVALRRPIQPAAAGSVFTVAEVDTRRWATPRYRLPVGWVAEKDLMPARKMNPARRSKLRPLKPEQIVPGMVIRTDDQWTFEDYVVQPGRRYAVIEWDDDEGTTLLQMIDEQGNFLSDYLDENVHDYPTPLLVEPVRIDDETIRHRRLMMARSRRNPPRKHQAKKKRSGTQYRARAWYRESDNIVWTGPWRDSRREAVLDAQEDYSGVSSRNYEIETSDGHVDSLSERQYEEAAAREYRHLRDRSVWGNPRSTEVDEIAAHELELYIDNDEPLYRKWQAIVRNLWKHKARGRYVSSRAADGFMYLVDDGAKKYAKEFASPSDWNKIFDKPTRRALAEQYAHSFENNERDEIHYAPEGALHNPSKGSVRTYANPAGTEILWIQATEAYVLVPDEGAILGREVLAIASSPDELDQVLREYNPQRRTNPDRRKNGAGLGALVGSTIGAVLGLGVASVPIAGIGSLAGGAIGGYVGAPKDRKKRGAAGGAIGGIFGPIGAGVGGYIGGRKPDSDYRRNPEPDEHEEHNPSCGCSHRTSSISRRVARS